MTDGVQCAASIRTSVVASEISVPAPPITPASEIAPLGSATTRSVVSRVRVTPSRVASFSPGAARRTLIGPARVAASKACSGCPTSIIT